MSFDQVYTQQYNLATIYIKLTTIIHIKTKPKYEKIYMSIKRNTHLKQPQVMSTPSPHPVIDVQIHLCSWG